MKVYLLALALLPALAGRTQQPTDDWNHKQCAVVLTYDDAIDADLDNVIPALDSVGLKATFYLIGRSPVIAKRMEEWRAAARDGHELGNHSLTHPCDGSLPDRAWVDPDHDLSKYSIPRAQDDVKINNVLLQAIDGKTVRTYAFPCGEFTIHDSSYYLGLRKDFVCARGVAPRMETMGRINLDNIGAYGMNGQTGDQMIELVKQAQEKHALLVFLFHGVGGGHNINVGRGPHSQLLHYLKDHSDTIWVAPMVDVALYVRTHQTPK